jgi:pyruvate,water dikinase
MNAFVLPASPPAPPPRVGGKAAALSQLVELGFDAPPFVVILAEAFGPDGLSTDAQGELERHFAELGDGPFAVRSSAREEDGATASHAGQFLSVLDVARADVAKAAMSVWRSGAAESVRAYRRSKGLDPDGGAPAVIVQRLVQARAAGVAFSADPISGDRGRVVISAVRGLGDRLVSGEVDGEETVLDKATGSVVSTPDQGLLSAGDLAALHRLVAAVEAAFGRPQDVEWAFEGERLFILQARPITTLRALPIADPATTIFDNSNIVESYPGLVSPLTYSFAVTVYARVYRMFVRLLAVDNATIAANGAVFDNMLGRIDGRVYYNLLNWYRALSLLPGFAINRAHMETMMGVDEPLPVEVAAKIGPPQATGLARAWEYLRVARVALRLAWRAVRLSPTIANFQRRLDAALSQPASALSAMPLTALAAEYRRIEAELLDRWDAPLINDFLCMIAFGASRKLLQRWAGERGLAAHNVIMIGQGGIVSAEPAQRIRRMGAMAAGKETLIERLKSGDRAALSQHADLAAEVDAYLAKFGDRCTEELKLESATLDEDPRPLLASIASAAAWSTPAGDRRRQEADEIAALFPRSLLRRLVARRILGWAKARVRDRENLRFERTRIFGRARKLFLAIGAQLQALGALADSRDVLFLTTAEALGAIEGAGVSSDLRGVVALRKAEMATAATRPDPPARVTFSGAAAIGAASRPAPTIVRSEDSARRGQPCSAGRVQARARVVRNPRTDHLAPGEILVASHTDPGWIAVFVNASAIVVERGSLLSHSAIVARELGIPCVVGIKGATDWVISGDMLAVDGESGVVSKVDV